MNENVMDINALPAFLLRLFSTARVSVSESNGVVQVMPVQEENSLEGLIGILADSPEMSVDKFLERMRADKELDL